MVLVADCLPFHHEGCFREPSSQSVVECSLGVKPSACQQAGESLGNEGRKSYAVQSDAANGPFLRQTFPFQEHVRAGLLSRPVFVTSRGAVIGRHCGFNTSNSSGQMWPADMESPSASVLIGTNSATLIQSDGRKTSSSMMFGKLSRKDEDYFGDIAPAILILK